MREGLDAARCCGHHFCCPRRNQDPHTPTESDMPHQDLTLPTGPAAHHQDLKAVLDWLLDRCRLLRPHASATSAPGPRGAWPPRRCSGPGPTQAALTERFDGRPQDRPPWPWASTPRRRQTYQAFLKLLRAWTAALALALVVGAGAAACRRISPTGFKSHGYAIFGVDGSRLELPRTASNQARLRSRGAIVDGPRSRPRPSGRRPSEAPPRRRRQEGRQPADVADHDVARRHRAALGLAARALRQQRARPPHAR